MLMTCPRLSAILTRYDEKNFVLADLNGFVSTVYKMVLINFYSIKITQNTLFWSIAEKHIHVSGVNNQLFIAWE